MNGARALVLRDMEKAKMLNATFTLVFTGKIDLHKPQVSETTGEFGAKKT